MVITVDMLASMMHQMLRDFVMRSGMACEEISVFHTIHNICILHQGQVQEFIIHSNLAHHTVLVSRALDMVLNLVRNLCLFLLISV